MRRRLRVLAAGAVLVGAGVGGAAAANAAGDHHAAAGAYGGLPSYLPSSSVRPDSTLVGSAARAAVTSEGDPVLVKLPAAQVTATVTGPVVPGEGLPYQAVATTATWQVTLTGASGAVPISTKAFSTIDSLGETYAVSLVPGQPAPPARILPGQTVHFALRAVMHTGQGLMRWAPVSNDLVASWDFEVEND